MNQKQKILVTQNILFKSKNFDAVLTRSFISFFIFQCESYK
jgi:hypothetical protein